jgi:hypothetical protein
MASDRSTQDLHGLLLQDPRLTYGSLWAAESTYDTASAQPGIPEAAQDSDMVLETSGSQSDAGSLTLLVQRSGMPGPETGARHVWRNTSDSTSSYRGWDPPFSISGHEIVDWETGGTESSRPHAVVLADDSVLVAYNLFSGGNSKVGIRKRAASGTWSSETAPISETSNAAPDPLHCCLVLMPSGRIRLYTMTYDDDSSTFDVVMHYSDDDGDSWTRGARGCLPERLTRGANANEYIPRRIRVSYAGGTWLLLLWAAEGTAEEEYILQYASVDGVTFEAVTEIVAALPDIVTDGSTHYVAYMSADGGTGQAYLARLSNAYSSLPDVAADPAAAPSTTAISAAFTANVYQSGDLAMAMDDTGAIYMFGRNGSQEGRTAISTDYGSSIDDLGALPGTNGRPWWDADDTDAYPDRFCAVWLRGRALVVHNWQSNSGTANGSLAVIYLGGYTDLCMPPYSYYSTLHARTWFTKTYLPIDSFADLGFTAIFGGAASGSLTSTGYATTLSGGGDSATFTETPASTTPDQGLMARGTVKTSGGTVVFALRTGDGAAGYEAGVRVTTTTVELWDETGAGSQIASASVDGTAFVQVWLAMAGDRAALWYRVHSTSEDRRWTLVGSTTSLTDHASGAGDRIQVRHQSAAGTAVFREFHYTAGITQADPLADVPTNPDDLFGRAIATEPVYVSDGVKVAAVAGPALEGDRWVIAARSDFDVRNLLPSVAPSPRRGWKSRTTTADMAISWNLDSEYGTGSENGLAGNYTIGLYLDRHNISAFRWAYTTNAGSSWTTIADVDTRIAIAYERRGNTVRPSNSSGSTGYYYERDELKGGYWQSATGDIRKIIGNTEGALVPVATSKTPIIFLEGIDGTEGASGDGFIWHPRVLVVAHLTTSAAEIGGYQIVLRPSGTAPAPAESSYLAGKLCVGPFLFFGTPYENRSFGIESNTDLVTMPDGSRRSSLRGDPRRRVEFSWPSGVPQAKLSGDAVADDFVTNLTSGGAIVAALHDIPSLVDGLMSEAGGAHRPLVYCPFVPRTTSPTTTAVLLTRRSRGAMYSRLVTSITQHDSVIGNEHRNELLRSGSLAFEEEL